MNQESKRPKLSPHDIRLIKGALRRAFARSEYYRSIADQYNIEHSDPKHPRCHRWKWCAICGQVTPSWKTDLDHKSPVVPLDRHDEDMDPHELLDRIFSAPDNLWILCEMCHNNKTSVERSQRVKKPRKIKSKTKVTGQ